MDYKKLIKSRDLRIKLLRLFDWLPDKAMIRLQYRIKLGRKLNLENPKRYTEKLQWYKLYYRNSLMKQCVDKSEVRKYVESKGLKKILNESYGTYRTIDEVDFAKLPKSFVIKSTAGGGGQNVIIVEDKEKMDQVRIYKTVRKWLLTKTQKPFGREWAYDGIDNRLIIEQFIKPDQGGLTDYKFFCFNGKVKYIYVISDRILGKSARLGIYDSNYKKINAYRADEQKQEKPNKKPKNFETMKKYAMILSQDFPHARIDLYNNNGKVIFGEITFYDGSGYMKFTPDSFDYELGKEWIINGTE